MAGKQRLFFSKEQLEAMYQTKTCREIAAEFGCGETAIWNRIKKFGIKLRGYENPRKRPKAFTEAHMIALRKAKKAIRGKFVGSKSGNWRGGLTAINLAARSSGEYREWKMKALELAGYKCQFCGVKKGAICECCGQKIALHVHHIESFAKFHERRFDPANSEVLCVSCHHSRHFGKTG